MPRLMILSLLTALFAALSLLAEETGNKLDISAIFEKANTVEEVDKLLEPYYEKYFQAASNPKKTREDETRYRLEYGPICMAAGDRIIALATDDQTRKTGYELKILGWNCLVLECPKLMAQKEAFLEEIAKQDKFPELVNGHQFFLFTRQLNETDAKTISLEDFHRLKDDAKRLATLPSTYNHVWPMQKVLEIAKVIETRENQPGFLDSTLEDLMQYATTNDQCLIDPDDAQTLRGFCRRLVGSPFALRGKTVEGKEFSWSDYDNKVVLVDFTASWCGPCRAEIPNLMEVYELYHDKGLEIISIGVKDTTENLKKQIEEDKFPWTMISEELSNEEDGELPSDYYGVYGIPEIFLVGRDGKILETRLFGRKIRSCVDELFSEKNDDTR